MKRAKKSKAGILIFAVLFCLAVVAGAGAFFLRGTGVFSDGAGYLSNPKEEAVCAETKALVLYVSNTEFQVGEEQTVRVTVFADGSLDGEVSVLDDQGIELCKLGNDKSGCLEGEISIKKEEPGVGKLFAVSGDEKSAPVSFYVTPVVTEEMVTELLAVTKELGDYAFEEGLSAPLDADGRKAIQEWLKKDERVYAITENNGIVLFETRNHLLGSYGMGLQGPMSYGFSEAGKVFEAQLAEQNTESLYIRSGIPETSRRFLHLNPIPENPVCQFCDPFFKRAEEKLAEGTDGSLFWITGEDTLEHLKNGSFTDCSYLALETHGCTINRRDGGKLLFMEWGEWEVPVAADMMKATGLEVYEYARFWGSLTDGDDSYRMVYDVTIQDGVRKYAVSISSNYLECVLVDKTFDNTIVYLIICYGLSDTRLADFLVDHGASAVLGCENSLDGGISIAVLEQMAQMMGSPGTDGQYGSLNKVRLSPVSKETDRLIRTEVYQADEDYLAGYVRGLKTKPVRYVFREDSVERVLAGEGTLCGTVLEPVLEAEESKSGEEKFTEAAEAEVCLYRWEDHEFVKLWSGMTDETGSFRTEALPFGTYAVYAKKPGMDGFVTAVLENGTKETTAEEVKLSYRGAENNGGNVVRYQGKLYYWRYNPQSVYSTAIFAHYNDRTETENELVCRNPDGSERVLLKAGGSGGIYVLGNRLYLDNGGKLFSVKLDGSDRKDYGDFRVLAADEKAGTLLGTSGERGNGLFLLWGKSQKILQVTSREELVLGAIDGYYYYSGQISAQEFALYQMKTDGNGPRELDRVHVDQESLTHVAPMELMKLGDTLYYSYGFYAGTGGFFQNGGLNCVKEDGSGKQTCLEFGELAGEEFLAEEKDGETLLYYMSGDDVSGSYIGFWKDYPYSYSYVKNRNTGEVKKSDFQLSRPGSFVCMDDGGIYMIKENSSIYRQIIPSAIAKGLGLIPRPDGTEETLFLIQELDVVGNDVFFSVEKSARSRENDFGWRPGYVRERTTVYTMKLGDTEAVELYSY